VREMLKHLVRVHERASKFPLEKARIFCLSCAERQKFAYDKSVTVVSAEDSRRAREYLDALWRQSIPVEPVSPIEATFDAEDAAANFVYVLDAITGMNSANYSASCKVVAEFAMNTLDSLAYSVLQIPANRVNDEIVDASDFVVTEILRQNQDLDFLEAALAPVDLDEFRARSQVDITLGAWFQGG
jgi:hypothetical protein